MRKFTHHHIKRHNNQVIVGTQNPIPGLDINVNEANTNDNNNNNQINSNGNQENIPENSNNSQKTDSDEIDDNINNNNNHESEDGTEKHQIRRSSSLPLSSNIINYTVQDGDTLQSISNKFGIRLSLLKKANGIYDDDKLHPGDNLEIFTNFAITPNSRPIEVSIYDAKERSDGLVGKLSLKNNDLIFTPKSIFHHSHHIDLRGYLESNIFPHPSTEISEVYNGHQRFILVINYLHDPSNRTTSVTEYFSGKRDDLEECRVELIKVADRAQESGEFDIPNPNHVYHSQDFVHGKPRSNSGRGNDKGGNVAVTTVSATMTMKLFRTQIQFLNGHMEILHATEVFLVRKQLPSRFQNLNWTRLYTNTMDGSFLKTFYRKVANKKPVLFLLKTAEGDTIGAFIPVPLMISDNYYGTGEMFLFNFKVEVPKFDRITSLSQFSESDQISSETDSKVQNDSNLVSESNNGQISPENCKSDQIASENNSEQISSENQNTDQIITHNNLHSSDHLSSENQNKDQISTHSNLPSSDHLSSQSANEQMTLGETKHAPKPRTVIKTYRWNTLRNFNNRLFILSNLDSILFGGGNSSALFINKDMCAGYSDPCDTFSSPRLTTRKKFRVAVIEVWQIG